MPDTGRNETALFRLELAQWRRYAAALGSYVPALVGQCARAGAAPYLLVERVVELWRMPTRAPRLWCDCATLACCLTVGNG